jgi:hypothetical protein
MHEENLAVLKLKIFTKNKHFNAEFMAIFREFLMKKFLLDDNCYIFTLKIIFEKSSIG